MEDRELLELAAKAAGIEIEWRSVSDMPGAEVQPCRVRLGVSQGWWNPLRRNADAFSAAAQKGISIIHEHPAFVIAKRIHGGEWIQFSVQGPDDYERATRHAITYCLSQIGRKIP